MKSFISRNLQDLRKEVVEYTERLMHGTSVGGQAMSRIALLMEAIETNGLSQPLIKGVEGHEQRCQ
jgi:hypothetical protein